MDYEQFDMPTPCRHCGETFDLYDGFGSDKWYQNIVICASCHEKESVEIEEDEMWYEINKELSNALFDLDKKDNLKNKLDSENIELIKKLALKLK